MKKYIFLLLAFAVAGITMSCEKEQPKQPDEDVVQPVDPTNDTEKFLGYWVRTENINEGVGVYKEHTYRFGRMARGISPMIVTERMVA